jgi:ribonuclease HII
MGASVINSPLKYDEALALRDSFSKNIYEKTFNFLIKKLKNKSRGWKYLSKKYRTFGYIWILSLKHEFFRTIFHKLCKRKTTTTLCLLHFQRRTKLIYERRLEVVFT